MGISLRSRLLLLLKWSALHGPLGLKSEGLRPVWWGWEDKAGGQNASPDLPPPTQARDPTSSGQNVSLPGTQPASRTTSKQVCSFAFRIALPTATTALVWSELRGNFPAVPPEPLAPCPSASFLQQRGHSGEGVLPQDPIQPWPVSEANQTSGGRGGGLPGTGKPLTCLSA